MNFIQTIIIIRIESNPGMEEEGRAWHPRASDISTEGQWRSMTRPRPKPVLGTDGVDGFKFVDGRNNAGGTVVNNSASDPLSFGGGSPTKQADTRHSSSSRGSRRKSSGRQQQRQQQPQMHEIEDDPMLALALIPNATRRNHATGRPFALEDRKDLLADGLFLGALKRRPASESTSSSTGRSSSIPDDGGGGDDELAGTTKELVHLEAWATTYLREDSGCPPSSFVYSQVPCQLAYWKSLPQN